MLRQRQSGSGLPQSGAPGGDYYGGSQYGNTGYGGYDQQSAGGNSNGYGGYSQQGGGSSSGGYGGYSQQSYGGYSGGGSSGYSASPDRKKDKRSSLRSPSFSMGGGNAMMLIGGLLVLWGFVMTVLWFSARGKYGGLLKDLNVGSSKGAKDLVKNLNADLRDARTASARSNRDTNRKMAEKQKELEKQNRALQKERDELLVKYEGPDKTEEESRLVLREEAFQEQIERMKKATRRESRRTIIERFGSGPHEVQFTIRLVEELTTFVVELASIDDVPHAVHQFLEQVQHGLWNGCYFYLNGPHVIQAGPQLSDEDDADADEDEDGRLAAQPFKELGLDTLAFPDYSENFPHVPWTLGFTGRPGGPDFYINKVDNSESHGPGGQEQHILDEEGDSCFGKIVRGQENAARLFAQRVYGDRSEWHYFIEDPVEIVKAEILNQQAPKDMKFDFSALKNLNSKSFENDAFKNLQDNQKPKIPKIEHAAVP